MKQQIIGSIYPEKLTFENNSFRTSRLNEVVRLIFLNTNELQSKNIGLIIKKDDQSYVVNLPGNISNQFLSDLKLLYR